MAEGAFECNRVTYSTTLYTSHATQIFIRECLVADTLWMRGLRPALLITAVLVSTTVAAAQSAHWVGTWASAPAAVPNTSNDYVHDTTVREIVHISVGGPSVRVTLSNELGADELRIGGAAIGISDDHGRIVGANHPLTFNGRADVSIAPGIAILSDPVAFPVPALGDLAITIFVPGQTITTLTQHVLSYQTNYSADGNRLPDADLGNAKKFYSCPFLKAVEVSTNARRAAIVCLGDSITDGVRSTRDKNARWPDVLARRLQANRATASIAVLNLGISGNRMLHDVNGPSALSRFDRDVLGQSGVRYVIILEGINDIGHTTHPVLPNDRVEASQLVFALNQMIERAHAQGIKVFGATLTPYGGAKTETELGDACEPSRTTSYGKAAASMGSSSSTKPLAIPPTRWPSLLWQTAVITSIPAMLDTR